MADDAGTLLYRDEVFRIQGAVFDVYRAFGAGFLEGVYQHCLEIEFEERGLPFEALRPLTLEYRGRVLRTRFVPDFICFGAIILELKAVAAIAPEHRAQLLNYLRATGLKLGLVVNFGCASRVQIARVVN